MSGKYVLDGHEPRPVEDVIEWARCVRVSTVFLGLDHGWGQSRLPVLFETMVFGGPINEWGDRYCTWDEAVKGHEAMVKQVIVAIENARVSWSDLLE